MKRLFGTKKPAPAPVNVSDVGAKVDARVSNLDQKINTLEQELRKFRQQMAQTKGGPGLASIKKRAMATLKRKKMYEQQRDNLAAQSFNIEQASFALETVKDTVDTVSAMKAATSQLKVEQAKINIDHVEDTMDEMEEMMYEMDEIQQVMGRSYGVGEDIDESELEAELMGLEEDWALDEEIPAAAEEVGEEGLPSYLAQTPAVPTSTPKKSKAEETVDEFGLPTAVAM